MEQEHDHKQHCWRCGGKLTLKQWWDNQGKRIVKFFCTVCLSFAVGTAELGFTELAKADHAINDFSTDAVQFIVSGTSTTVAPSGEIMIAFANIQKIEHPQKVQISNEETNLV